MLLPTNLVVALLSWIAFRWIGLENAGAWAAATGLLHVVPYLGPGVTALATGMAAFMQFQSLPVALLVAGSSLAIATLVGILVTTWMTGRIAHMNSTAVFISQPAQHIEYRAQLPHDLAFRDLQSDGTRLDTDRLRERRNRIRGIKRGQVVHRDAHCEHNRAQRNTQKSRKHLVKSELMLLRLGYP
ncbi:MAG TPA: hypothetical protein VN860_01990 [Candidatus Acidoferrales bacterium]|nr:hypothetical protein [Candidatus Acidoferrales bacterium]